MQKTGLPASFFNSDKNVCLKATMMETHNYLVKNNDGEEKTTADPEWRFFMDAIRMRSKFTRHTIGRRGHILHVAGSWKNLISSIIL